MKRWWLAIALLLSLGVNAGILATFAVSRLTAARAERPAAGPEATAEAPAGGPGAQRVEEEPAAPGPVEPTTEGATAATTAKGETPAEEPSAAPAKRPAGAEAKSASLGKTPPAKSPGSGGSEAEVEVEIPAAAGTPAGSVSGPLGREAPPVGPQAPPEPLVRRLERLADYVGVSGETRTRFLVLQRRMFVSVVAAERRRLALEGELRRELLAPLAPNADEARIQGLIRRQADLLVEMEQTTARTILQSRRLLGPDQERRYLEVISRLRPRLHEEAMRRRQQGPAGGPNRPRRPFRRPR